MSSTVKVAIDWNKNGVYTNVGDVVTDRVRGTIRAQFGRDQSTNTSPMIAGLGSFALDNTSRDYSPRNTSSPLSPNVKPARPVRISRTIGATTYTIFDGHTDDAPINPDTDSKLVSFSLVDWLADFRGQTISTPLYEGLRTGQIIDVILTAAGWTGGRDLDTGATIVPWWWADGADVFDMLTQIVTSEGPPAMLTIGPSGEVVFRDRHHRLIRTNSLVSQSTWRGTEGSAEPVMSRVFSYDAGWRNIVNNVSFSVDERAATGSPIVVWSTEETISVPALGSTTIVIQSSDPFYDAIAPVEDIDFSIITGIGSISSVTLSRTSGQSTSITFNATLAVTIGGVQLRATAVPVKRTYQITATDSASITDYGQRGVPSGSDPVWASRQDVQDIANQFILQRAQPLPVLTVGFICATTQDARLTAVLALDLSDRVTVTEVETALSAVPFFIESITHTTTGTTEHQVVFGLEAVPSSPTSAFILGTSTLNGTAPLGY